MVYSRLITIQHVINVCIQFKTIHIAKYIIVYFTHVKSKNKKIQIFNKT